MFKTEKKLSPACLVFLLCAPTGPALADCTVNVGGGGGGGNLITCNSAAPNPFVGIFNVDNDSTTDAGDNVVLQADTVIAPSSDQSTFSMGDGNDDISGSGAVIFGTGETAIDMDKGNNTINLVDSALFGGEGVEEFVDNGVDGSTFYFEGVLFDSLDWGTAGVSGSLGVDNFELVNSRMIVESTAIDTSLNGDIVTVSQSTIENSGTVAIDVSTGPDTVTINDSIVVSREMVLNGGQDADSFTVNNSRLEIQERENPRLDAILAGLGADRIEIGNCSEILGNITAGGGDDVVAIGNLAILEGTVKGDNGDLENPSPDNDVLRFTHQLAAGPSCDQLITDIGNLPTPDGNIVIDGITYNYQGFESIESALTCSTAVSCAEAPTKGAGDLLFDDLRPPRKPPPTQAVPQAVPLPAWVYLLSLGLLGLLAIRQLRFRVPPS